MVLRSGIIIPFQFRDTKKLLMIGVPQENRDLNIWDLKNVGKHWSGRRGEVAQSTEPQAIWSPKMKYV